MSTKSAPTKVSAVLGEAAVMPPASDAECGLCVQSHLLAYLESRDGKIWILTDNTEDGIASELVAEGVAKTQIVLDFYSPALREAGEFAVR